MSVTALALAVGGIVLETASTPRRATKVAGTVHERLDVRASRSGTGFEQLGRLRRADGAPVEPAAPAPAGDVAIAPPPQAFDEPATPPPPPPPALDRNRFADVVPEGGTWAVVVGINDYPGSKYDLRSAVADADDVNAALVRFGVPASNRVVLRDARASGDTIRSAIDWLVAHAGPDATAVFFYAGHVRKVGSGTEAIIGSDGGAITDDEVAARLEPLQARRAWIGLAACYAGGFTELNAPGRIISAAAPANSLAYENEAFGRSYLVEYMVRRAMLEARADRSIETAFAFAEAELRRDYPNRVPVQYDSVEGELDPRPPGARTSSPPPPPPPDGGGTSGGTTGGGSGGGGGGSGGGTTPPPQDPCTAFTGGVVRCGGT